MDPQWAIVTGLVAGILVTITQPVIDWFKLDDVVGAVSVHLVGGIWGTLAAGMFSAKNFMSYGQIWTQMVGIAAVGAFTFVTAYIVYALLDSLIGVRVSALHEQRGLDIAEHAELGYPEFQTEQLHAGAAAAQARN